MSELLAQFAEPVVGGDRTRYRAQACGAATNDGRWEAWIEFSPVDGGPSVRSPRETTQPNKTDAEYWATGLTPIYLEGALRRALKPLVVKTTTINGQAIFDSPSVNFKTAEVSLGQRAILDPFSVYEKGESLLRQELSAFSAWHLINIIVTYRLSDLRPLVLNRMTDPELIDVIVDGVRQQTAIKS